VHFAVGGFSELVLRSWWIFIKRGRFENENAKIQTNKYCNKELSPSSFV